MTTINQKINSFTIKFEDSELENDYLRFKWKRIWPNLKIFLIAIIIIKLFINIDDIRTLGYNVYYIGYHILDFLIYIWFLFFLSNDNKRKFHQIYLLLGWIGFMNVGAWSYYFSAVDFPPGEGVVVTSIIIPLTVYPFHFLNSITASLFSSIPMMIMLLSKNTMVPAQIGYLFFMPLLFIVFAKRNFEYRSRKDFAKGVQLESNRKLMQETLKRYFGETLTEKILVDKGDLTGNNIWVSISFTDISAYSTIIEHMSPENAVKFLNQYFSGMHDVIEKHKGQIINYIGDSVMVVFGAPEKLEDHEIISVKCAIDMRKKLKELNEVWDKSEFSRYWKNHGIDKITARTGIHTGSVIAGNIGSDRMLQYSTIGDTVNVASRLEQANKKFESEILFSQEIYTSLTKDLNAVSKYEGEINLKGRDTLTKVFSI